MLEIRAPRYFRHAGQLNAEEASYDPRRNDFPWDVVRINLQACEFIYPPAVLWCAVFPALVRKAQIDCELLTPENHSVAAYLNTQGLLSALVDFGVIVDDRSTPAGEDSKLVLPLRRFNDYSQSKEIQEEVLERLDSSGHVAGNVVPVIAETLGELMDNARQHADSPIGAFATVQFYDKPERGPRLACVVADGGVGIRATLSRTPADFDDDSKAIEHALNEHVSGTGDSNRGIGLTQITEDMSISGREFIIHSGWGTVALTETDGRRAFLSNTLFPGVLAAATVSVARMP